MNSGFSFNTRNRRFPLFFVPAAEKAGEDHGGRDAQAEKGGAGAGPEAEKEKDPVYNNVDAERGNQVPASQCWMYGDQKSALLTLENKSVLENGIDWRKVHRPKENSTPTGVKTPLDANYFQGGAGTGTNASGR